MTIQRKWFMETVAYLKALTIEAQTALHGHQLQLDRYPFRVGRECRGPNAHWLKSDGTERRRSSAAPTNELYLWEQGREVYVSRNHLQIERDGDGFVLVDRESALGTWVEGSLVGGNRRGGQTALHHGDVIIIGAHRSGFIFKFIIEGES